MVQHLNISSTLKLPLDWITLATVVYGARGSGKTSFGRVTAEEAHKAGLRFCAIDLKGDWYGLKSSADGKSDGLEVVVFGGEHADVPLEPDAGAFVGETVAKLEQSTILDFELFSKGKQIRFLASFFEALYHHNREPLLLLLDEAQRYAPQKPGPDEARTLGAVQDLVKLGRKHGIGPVLFTQRGAGLSKEVSELCDLLVAFRTPGPLDQERIRDWLDANATKAERDEIMGDKTKQGILASLPTGTAVFASGHPELKTFGVYPVRRPETFDSSATPKVGQRRAEPKKLAKADLTAITAKMADAIARAKADDPKALKARIAELERQIGKGAQVAAPERVEVPMFDADAFAELERETAKEVMESLERLRLALGNQKGLLHTYRSKCLQSNGAKAGLGGAPRTVSAARLPPAIQPPPAPGKSFRERTAAQPPGTTSMGQGGQRKMMIALAQRPDGLTRSQIAIRAGISAKSSSLDTYLSRARSMGWIDGRGQIQITTSGLAALGDFEPLPTGTDLLEYWLRELGDGGMSRALRAFADVYPDGLTREQVAQRAGISESSSSLDTYLSRLRSLELIEGRGTVKASAELF